MSVLLPASTHAMMTSSVNAVLMAVYTGLLINCKRLHCPGATLNGSDVNGAIVLSPTAETTNSKLSPTAAIARSEKVPTPPSVVMVRVPPKKTVALLYDPVVNVPVILFVTLSDLITMVKVVSVSLKILPSESATITDGADEKDTFEETPLGWISQMSFVAATPGVCTFVGGILRGLNAGTAGASSLTSGEDEEDEESDVEDEEEDEESVLDDEVEDDEEEVEVHAESAGSQSEAAAAAAAPAALGVETITPSALMLVLVPSAAVIT